MRFAYLALLLAACGGGNDTTDAGPDATDAAADGPAACTPAPAGAPAERVATTSGTVHGTAGAASFSYLGIPYAAPPTGDLRFASPAAPACATADIEATAFGPVCPQLDADGNYSGDEDCLHLNVWAPNAASGAPVMVFIHGGANVSGTSSDPLYDGHLLAEAGGVVVVTLDYRLAQLGFLDHPAIAAADMGSGNFGLLDQIAALRWVHDNIAGFGGDPANVTVFGESAGGRDTCSIVAAPSSAGLFAHAIVESGSCAALPTRTVAQETGATYATDTSCASAPDVLACLRALPAETAIRTDASSASILVSTLYQPVIDGTVQPVEPIAAMQAGTHHHVTFMVGSNADETGKEAPAVPDETTYDTLVQQQFGPFAPQVLQQYPATAPYRAQYVRLTTDARFVCPTRQIARAATAGQSEAVYRYFFSYPATPFGAVHGIELPFVFGTFSSIDGFTPNATELAISAAMQADWTTFAHGGAPTSGWPSYGADDPARDYDATIATIDGVRTDACDFWQQLENSPI